MVNYREKLTDTKEFKEEYVDGLEKLILSRQQVSARKRKEYCKNIMLQPEAYREDFRKMLGWPLTDHSEEGLPRVKRTKLAEEKGYCIYRMQFQIIGELEMTGLYFEMREKDKKPLVLVQHGGSGTPEAISGVYGGTSNYNQMLERVIAHGVHAFAPQLLLWNTEKYGVPYDRRNMDARLKRVGGSIASVELYGLMRILDYFEAQDNVSNFGMVGLSYGGFYTLFLSALDTRIRSAISCSFFNMRDQYPWNDWTWFRSAEKFDDAEIACMIYPRKFCIEIGDKDPLFDVAYGVRAYENLLELCRSVDDDWLTFITFDGNHEFCKDDEPIQSLIRHIS